MNPNIQKIEILCNVTKRNLPAILKITYVWRDVTLAVISEPMFTPETAPQLQ